jgi:Tat protein translocase TatC
MIDERRLTFGEHLHELRGHVMRAVLYVAVAGAICLVFQDRLLSIVLWPQQRVGGSGREERLAAGAESLEAVLADVRARPLAGRPLEERREVGRRLAAAMRELQGGPDPRVAFLSPQEPFMAYLKVALICALFLSSPFIARELWGFVAAGLHDNEQRWVRLFAPLSFVCFLAGVLFGYFVLIPTSLTYLETYGSQDLVVATITLDGYLDLFFDLTLAVGLTFEVPIVLVFLSLIGVVDAAQLAGFRRYFVLVATIFAAIITPTGDPITLIVVTLPILALYEVGLLSVKSLERRRMIQT